MKLLGVMDTDFSGQVNHQESSVGVAIRRNIVTKLTDFCIAYSDRLMSLRLPLTKDRSVTFVSVYAPTLNSDDAANLFYNHLHDLLVKIPADDKLIVMGDFNARVGRDYISLGLGSLDVTKLAMKMKTVVYC